MAFGGITHGYNLNEYKEKKKTFKDTFDLKKSERSELVQITGDIKGQVVYSEKGSNIVITACDTQEVTYRKTEVQVSSEQITSGKNKGKYECVTTTYTTIYDEDGNVTDYSPKESKTTYVRKQGNDEVIATYETLNSKNKVIATTTEDVRGQNKIIVNTGKILGTVTYKNGETFDKGLVLRTNQAEYDIDLVNQYFAPVKSGNKYTGTWLQELASSTSANETFNLGVNRSDLDSDVIKYDMSSKQGKDTIVLAKDGRVDVEFENDSDIVRTFSKNKNNIILKMGKTADYSGSDYVKVEFEVTKSGSKYWYVWKEYVWDEENEEYPSTPTTTYEPCELTSEVKSSMEHSTGIKFTVGTHTCYRDEEYNFYLGEASPLAQVTFKDYLKLAQDGVTIGENSLKTLLESEKGVGILGSSEATRKQTLTGTFLREQFYGGTNNDTISTGDDYDTIYLSEGRDTITVNGSGLKSLDYIRPAEELSLGNTTVKFAKGVEFGFDEDGNVAEGKTALSLVGIKDKLGNYGFEKSGNDLIIDSDAIKKLKKRFGADAELENKTLTIKDFFAEKGAINGTILGYDSEHLPVTFDDYGVPVYQFGNEKKANKIEDTKYQDILAGGVKADKFTITNGDAQIFADKGNDTINIENTAEGTINLFNTIGSGKDVVNIADGTEAEIMVDGRYSGLMAGNKADISFEKTGDDLIFNMTYFKDVEAGIRKDINDSLTVKNFFNNEFDVAFGYNNLEPDDWYDVNEKLGKKLIVNGIKDTDKTSPTYKKTVFGGTDYADSMTYAGKGAAYVAGGQGDDEYNVTLTKSSDLIISDTSGDNDVFLTNSVNNFRMLLNIDNEGNLVVDEDGSSLYVFNKSDFTAKNVVKGDKASGKIEIDSFFTLKDEAVYFGENYSMSAKEGALYMKNYIGQITSAVAGWFTTHEGYADVEAVLAENNANDVKSLIAVFDVNCPIDER